MTFHLYKINEIYSNADGTMQYIELSVGNFQDQGHWVGQHISVSNGVATHTLEFTHDLPSELTANTTVLIATQAFADIGVVKPDFIIPDNFLFTASGTVNFAGVDSVVYFALPSNGQSVNRFGALQAGTPKNFAGATITIDPLPPTFTVTNGTADDDHLTGVVGNDQIYGFAGNDTLDGGQGGNDTLDGGDGTDTALLYALSNGITAVSGTLDHLTVTAWGRVTTYIDVERVQAFDKTFAFDTHVGDSLWNLAALVWAGTGFKPSAGTLWTYASVADSTSSINELSHELLELFGLADVGAADFVTHLFQTVLQIDPTPDQVAAVTALMGPGHLFETDADLLAYVAVQSINTDKMVDFTGSVQQLIPSQWI
ncbi:calcium-binding protein [Caenimonas koreensis]|uniref:Hemolysin-type calcium-binding repeat-containing protein n=1 Tax=Caenimonas koreensis DSM 17982 TaxID=1121255 RepID=A0A844BCB1_9BURK|nr:calcium-binding protein [Caenimonas koreensis]MRD48141.1 hypothetical protein [Caenimonas koreensis DSM 17982]